MTKVSLFFLFRWCLRAIFNSDIFETFRLSPGVSNSQYKIRTFLKEKFNPPFHLGHCPKFSRFFLMTPPLSNIDKTQRTGTDIWGESSAGKLMKKINEIFGLKRPVSEYGEYLLVKYE